VPSSHPSLGLCVFFLSFFLRREARGAAIARGRQAAASSRNEDEESDETEDEAAGERTTRARRPRGGMKVAGVWRIGEGLRGEIGRGRERETPKAQGWATAGTTLLSLKSKIPVWLCGGWWRRAVLPSGRAKSKAWLRKRTRQRDQTVQSDTGKRVKGQRRVQSQHGIIAETGGQQT